ncbi:MAG: right-handed parallel beta-helix repeat-containing protein, partial [Candidatus Thorarchaeota archaeon]
MKVNSKRVVAIGLVFCFLSVLSASTIVHANEDSQIIISPSGDMTGVQDANAIEEAFRTVDPGGTVKLKKGQFYVSRVIEVEGFDGTFRGAGKDKTIIEAVENYEPGSYLIFDPFSGFEIPIVFFFLNPVEYVQISDMTVEINEPNPSAEYFNPWGGGPTHALTYIFHLTTTGNLIFDTLVSKVRIRGAAGDFNGFNLLVPVDIRNSAESSVHVVEYCDFENAGADGLHHLFAPGTSVIVRFNTFDNMGWAAHYVHQSDSVVFSHNTVSRVGWYGGIYYWECNSGYIYNNLFTDNAPSPWRGKSAIILRDSQDFVVSNNEFVNALGIRLLYGSRNNVIAGNDFRESGLPGWEKSGTFPTEYGCVWLVGDIFGIPPSTENVVIEWRFPEGTTLEEQVLDEGVDN